MFSVEQVVAALRKSKGMKGPAAEALGCSYNTVTNYQKRHPTVAEAIREERQKLTDIAELSLVRAIQKGEGWAVVFYLRTQAGDRGYVERHQIEIAMQHEWDKMLANLEDNLDPSVFRQVTSVLAGPGN